jgi:hypothetical protein
VGQGQGQGRIAARQGGVERLSLEILKAASASKIALPVRPARSGGGPCWATDRVGASEKVRGE